MKKIVAFVVLTLLTLLFSSVSPAAIIKYEFTGTIMHLPSGDYSDYYLENAIGYFSYDTSWSSSGGVTPSGEGERESYLSDSQYWSFGLFIGDLSFEASAINTPYAYLTVQNNGTFNDSSSDLIWDQFSYHGTTFDSYHWQVGISEYQSQPNVPDVFTTTEIPIDLILSDFNSTFAILSVDSSRLRVTLDSLNHVPVPEPISIMLLGFGLLGIAGLRRRRKGALL